MRVVGSLQRVCLPGILPLLLLLAVATTPVQRVGAQASDTDDTATASPISVPIDPCVAVNFACGADATCVSCSAAAASSNAAVTDCFAGITLATTEEGCDLNMGEVCCLAELSEFDCLGNDALLAAAACNLGAMGCADEITCDGDADDDDDEDSGAAVNLGRDASTAIEFSCTFMFVLPLPWI